MKIRIKHITASLLFFLIALLSCQDAEEKKNTNTFYYAIELKGEPCGYYKVTEEVKHQDDNTFIIQDAILELNVTLMGKEIKTLIELSNHRDSSSKKVVYTEEYIKQGDFEHGGNTSFNNNIAYSRTKDSEEAKEVILNDDVIVENLLYYPHLVRAFSDSSVTEKEFMVFDDRHHKVEKITYKKIGIEDLFLGGDQFKTLVLEVKDQSSGATTMSWVNLENGLEVKNHVLNNDRLIYLTDQSIIDNQVSMDVDDLIFYKVHKKIDNSEDLTYMEIKAEIKTLGEVCSVNSLNVPGQIFDGEVVENHINGKFTIQPIRYHGENAPPFPADYLKDTSFTKYLEPEELIQSDDPEIMELAKEITMGAEDSWDAMKKLSEWVHVKIKGAIPGGGDAKGVLKTREGECGGHSRLLTAFCRAVGIPARVCMGGAYVPDNGGFFGQHMWVEVYMGEAGWIPVDATFGEIDYIDAGHIRLGGKTSFHPQFIEILDYQLAPDKKDNKSLVKRLLYYIFKY